MNPVRARLAARAEDWPWSSARACLGLSADSLTDTKPTQQSFPRIADLRDGVEDEAATQRLRKGESVGRPIGSDSFLKTRAGRRLRPLLRGPKPKDESLA